MNRAVLTPTLAASTGQVVGGKAVHCICLILLPAKLVQP